MTSQEFHRQVSSGSGRRDRAVLIAFSLSWLSAIAMALAMVSIADSNHELRSEAQALASKLSLAETAVVLERAKAAEAEAELVVKVLGIREARLASANAAMADKPRAPSKSGRRPHAPGRSRRTSGSSGAGKTIDIDCTDKGPLCGLGATRSFD